ncbi:MAG TPA: sulfur oxidation c-type cytochrome SoxA [Burkholderiales bacterium]
MTARFLILVLICSSAAGAEIPLADRRSGYEFMGRDTRAMQDDDATNPATLWVLDGEALWNQKAGAAGKACADCHSSMKGVAARYPALHAGKLLNLDQRINACRVERQKAPALQLESRDLLALSAWVGRQSRGMPIDIEVTEQLKPYLESGRAAFNRREGQLNIACAQCHDERWGARLAGNPIPQAHPTGYPIYRLEWQGVGSLQRRLRNCMIGVRAEPYEYGSPEFVELELYLMWRARGMKLETPAVRP